MATTSYDVPPVPKEYAAAFERVQEQLHAGNSYEVNLTYRVETPSDLDPAATPTSGCAPSTPRRTPGSCSTTYPATGRGCSAPRPSATPW